LKDSRNLKNKHKSHAQGILYGTFQKSTKIGGFELYFEKNLANNQRVILEKLRKMNPQINCFQPAYKKSVVN